MIKLPVASTPYNDTYTNRKLETVLIVVGWWWMIVIKTFDSSTWIGTIAEEYRLTETTTHSTTDKSTTFSIAITFII